MSGMSAKDVLTYAKERKVEFVDMKFIDFPGVWQHITYPIKQLELDSFVNGFGFDGSSIRGWQPINASDMLLVPDPTTAVIDPFCQAPTLSLICNIFDPITMEPYSRDPRNIAMKAEKYLKSTGLADIVNFGPEAEFFVFDSVRYDAGPNHSSHHVDSIEGQWNTGREEGGANLGYKPRYKEGYFPVAPTDTLYDLRCEMVTEMQKMGIEVETHHHEVATGGQCEIDMKYDTLTKMADKLMWFKYIIKNVARRRGKTVTFMPKPLYGDNGSGMHCHMSLWKGDKPLFAGDGYQGMSEMAMFYIGGVINHAQAVCGFSNPTTNSYRRLVPGYEAPINLAYSARNRSAAVRIPVAQKSPKSKRIEFRTPDPSCNPYLAFSAMLMAGLDGVEKKMNPGQPMDKDIYGLSPEELKDIPAAPGSLEQALNALQKDHKFMLKGDVFTPDVIDTWIEYKTKKELDLVRMRPTPLEFSLYFDI